MLTLDSDPSEMENKPKKVLTQICSCGHQRSKHNDDWKVCNGARESCPCKVWDPVIEVPDARLFMYGPGASGHPLVMGLLKTKERGKLEQVVFLESECRDESCDREWKTAAYTHGGKVSIIVCTKHAIRTAETE